MTRRGMTIFSVTLAALMMLLAPAQHVMAAGWADNAYYGNGNQDYYRGGNRGGHGGGIFKFGPTTTKIAKFGVTAVGTVMAGVLGSQFGTLGTIAGGAAGFFVSRWIGDKLFGQNQWDHGQSYDNRSWFTRLKDKIFGRSNPGPFPPHYGNGGDRWSKIRPLNQGSQDLATARRDLYQAGEDLKRALQSGSDSEKASAKAAYDAASARFTAARNGQ